MSFVLSGMLLASSLTGGAETLRNAFSRFYLTALGLVSMCAVAWSTLVHDSPAEAWVKFADFTYRGSNMPGYYLIGIVTSVFWITLFSLLIGTRELSRPVKFFLPLGLSSLFLVHDGQRAAESLGLRGDPARSDALHRGLLRERPDHHEVHRPHAVLPSANELMCLRFPRRAHAEASLQRGSAPARSEPSAPT